MESGSQLGNYVIKDRIGRGATAEVFRALQPAIDRDVAIKVMFPHLTDSPDFSARFQREARAMGRLQHPGIGRVIDFDASGERPYMVMEYLDGGSLQELMQEAGGPLPVEFALQVTRQLADALRYAHDMGMVHRDIKPANVMFTDTSHQSAVLMDFGMARLVDESMTATGAVLGTPAFMAPEQMRGEVIGAPGDQYSLGVMLFEMVTGQPLYQADSVHSLMMKHVEAPVPSARESTPTVSKDVDSLLQTMLAKSPADRYADPSDVVSAIDQLLGSSATTSPTPKKSAVPARQAKPSGGRPNTQNRSRAGLIGAILAVALVAAGTVFALTRGGDGNSAEVVATAQAADTSDAASDASDPGVEEDVTQPNATQPSETQPETVAGGATEADAPALGDDIAEQIDVGAELRASFDPAAPPAFFATSARMDGDEFVLAWDRSRPARIGGGVETEYVINTDLDEAPLGIATIDADGRGSIRATVAAHLASTLRVTAVDRLSGESADVVLENTMSPLQRTAFDRRLQLVSDVERELAIALDHRGFIGDELANGDLTAARRHTEHVINIIDGIDGPRFGDLDGSGLAENPGDGVGVLVYAANWAADDDGSAPDQLIISTASGELERTQAAGAQLLSSDLLDEAGRSFENLSLSLEAASAAIDQAKSSLRNQAVEALVGPSLELTGTDSSSGTISVLPSSGHVIVHVTNRPVAGEVSVQTAVGDFTAPSTGLVTIDAGSDFASFGSVVLLNSAGESFGSGALNPNALAVYQELTDGAAGLLTQLNGQAQIVADHADLMRQEVEATNHNEVRRHAEHVVNIIGGEQGAQFGDLNGDGAAQNPGDGIGVLIYLDRVDALLDALPNESIEQRFHIEAYRSSVEGIRGAMRTAQAEALRVLATDTAAEAEAPMLSVMSSSIAALDGSDTDASGFIDIDESGARLLPNRAMLLLSAPLEP